MDFINKLKGINMIEKLLDYQIEELLKVKNPSSEEMEMIVKIYIQKMKNDTDIKKLMMTLGREPTEHPKWFNDVDFE